MQSQLNAKEAAHAKAVRDMFAGIARRYDLLNHVLSLNIDKRWRRIVAEELRDVLDRQDAIVLDVACGTGDLAIELNREAKARVVGTDFCRPMLTVAYAKNDTGHLTIPYVEGDAVNPLGAYGRSKLAGERSVAASGCAHLTLRTSWVYGPLGKNFMLTMLRLAATQEELRVVEDQRGAPTSSLQLARAVRELFTRSEAARAIEASDVARIKDAAGLYHASAAGETTWFDFAREIFAARARASHGAFTAPRVIPIATREYPTPARRPAYSVLSSAKLEKSLGVRIGDWRSGLEEALSALPGR